MTSYKLLIPPQSLASTNVKAWSSKEAKLYFQWFLENKLHRIDNLHDFLNINSTVSIDDLIAKIIERQDVVKENFTQIDSSRNELILNNQGYAFFHDFGVFFGEQIVSLRSDIRWGIMKLPKSDLSYNLPVIIGYESIPKYFDPIRLSIVNWIGILNEKLKVDEFAILQNYILNKK